MKRLLVLTLLSFGCALVGPPAFAGKLAGQARRPAVRTAPKDSPAPKESGPDIQMGGRVVQYGEQDVVLIRARVRYTTLIVLPKGEEILDFACGDKEFWVINGNQNLAYVKPAKTASQTNLNLITASGNIYSFVLAEVSEAPSAEPDLKVFVELNTESMRVAAGGPAQFVSARQAEDWRQQVELAKAETREVKAASQAAVDAEVTKFISNVRFPYRFEAGTKPFYLRAMYHDDNFTYIQARPEETPTLYEIKDGKPNLVNFQYKDGVYVVGKILERGYLAIGKKKLRFTQEE